VSASSLGSWLAEAACRGAKTNLFFPDSGDSDSVSAAKAICARCAVVAHCRAHGLATPAERGIWGGLTEQERHGARKQGRKGEAA
jgi:WhiB family redox-sensing transcriptional regulator